MRSYRCDICNRLLADWSYAEDAAGDIAVVFCGEGRGCRRPVCEGKCPHSKCNRG
jgi:hypothetical protein